MKYLVKVSLNVRKIIEVTDEDIKGLPSYDADPKRFAEKQMVAQAVHMAKVLSAVEPALEVDASSYADASKLPDFEGGDKE